MEVALLKERRTKLVATLGPATSSPSAIGELLDAGVDVVRLNLSHGEHDGHARNYRAVRQAAAERSRPVAVLADLCGPKIRVGRFPGGPVVLQDGAAVTLTTRDVPGTSSLIPSSYAGLTADVSPGDRVLLADGMLHLRAESVSGTEVECTVLHGGPLSDRKGLNLPDSVVSAPALTEQDRVDAAFAAELGVDWLALSFVQSAADVVQLRELLGGTTSTPTPSIIAKIERPNAVREIEGIVAAADGIMVARGDLGVELPPEDVPVAQRRLIAAARRQAKPVIVATQMLESMVEHPQPTRAEVSDVSTAVFASADAVMLSAETAVGAHPAQAVQMLDRVARRVEAHQWDEGTFRIDDPVAEDMPLAQAVARSTAQLSRDLRVRAIVVASSSGRTPAVVSAARPAAPIICVTEDQQLAPRLALLWGVIPQVVPAGALSDPGALARTVPAERGVAIRGQRVLLVTGFGGSDDVAEPSLTVVTCTG